MEDDLIFVLGNLGSGFSVCNLILTRLDEIWRTTSIHMEDNFNNLVNDRRPPKLKTKTM